MSGYEYNGSSFHTTSLFAWYCDETNLLKRWAWHPRSEPVRLCRTNPDLKLFLGAFVKPIDTEI